MGLKVGLPMMAVGPVGAGVLVEVWVGVLVEEFVGVEVLARVPAEDVGLKTMVRVGVAVKVMGVVKVGLGVKVGVKKKVGEATWPKRPEAVRIQIFKLMPNTIAFFFI